MREKRAQKFGEKLAGGSCYLTRVPEYIGKGADAAHDLSKDEKDLLEAEIRKQIVAHRAAKEQKEASKKRRRCSEISVAKSRRGHQGREH